MALKTKYATGLDLEDFENDRTGSWLQRGSALLSAVDKLADVELSDSWDVSTASDFAISESVSMLGNEEVVPGYDGGALDRIGAHHKGSS